MDKNKVLYIDSAFSIKKEDSNTDAQSVYIEGYASTVDRDRSGDVVSAAAWKKGSMLTTATVCAGLPKISA